MYICPTCGKEFLLEADIAQHYLKCWKIRNPYHESKDAPRSQDIVTFQINDDVKYFFNQFTQGEQNGSKN